MDGKYGPLYEHIHRLDKSGVREWQASFTEIEKIIGDTLPPSARQYNAWWSNDTTGHYYAQAWLSLGWRTHSLNLAQETVSFERQI
ncbi:MAG: hypothetical protein OXH22_13445 [Chloroflexi bacterium]|nr:hypothetical protein [Chloroflexota bacterium]